MYGKAGLTLKMLILIATLGMAVWVISDTYQTKTLENIFLEKLAARFSLQAQEHRTRFDRHIKAYSQAAKLLVRSKSIHDYTVAHTTQWSNSKHSIIYYQDAPKWMPDHSILRKFILPRYTLLLDQRNVTKEVYYWNQQSPPKELVQLSSLLLRLSNNQSYLTTLAGIPYLITSEPILESGKRIATLVLGSPIDSAFLNESQEPTTSKHTVALLSEDEETILVSSDPTIVPTGTKVSSLKNVYLTIGKGFFDYGSTDLIIRCVSFIPLSEVNELTLAVLDKERQLRSLTTLAYTLTFMLVMFYLTRQLRRLTKRVVDFSENMAITQPAIHGNDELAILEERFKLLTNAIQNETAALEYQASHDPLTELPNRKMLNERLQNSLVKSQITNSSLVLIISDLNHFKEINDTLGHHIGDLVLQQASERLYNTVRRTDTVARLGGDEFGILLPETTLDQAELIVKKIVEAFAYPFVAEGHNLNVGISIGMVESPRHGNDVNILVQRADVAMYSAKRDGGGYAIYNPDTDTYNVGRLTLMSELVSAIDDERLELFYQAKQDIKTGAIIGAEGLLRWRHAERGTIHPDDFIPLAKQTGLMKPLTQLVIKQALHQCSVWCANGLDLTISLNISVQSLHDSTLIATLERYLSEYKLTANHVILEITESEIMIDPIRAKSTLAKIRELGVNISIDDFGTGYSSLSYLKQLPISEIKIDRSFVTEMNQDENDKVIVRTIIDLAHNLGMSVVAEGVESEAAMDLLKLLNCNLAQGFYINEPLSAGAYIEFLQAHRAKINNLAVTTTSQFKPRLV